MHEREQQIFQDALATSGPDARRAYLDIACAGDETLRRRVEILLHAHEGARQFLERPILGGPDPTVNRSEPTAIVAPTGPADTPTRALDATTRSGDDSDAAEDDPLDFLAPTERSDSRGRLAHYEVLEVLGRGGFGTVVRAFDDKLHRMVAIKLMARNLAATSPPRKRFLREARAAAAVRHPHVVAIHAVDEVPVPYLVMEYIAGPTLQAKIDQIGPIEPGEVVRIGLQIAEGLAAAHRQGLVHRDIKPANILLEDAAERVKITDFGLARLADDASLTQSGVIAGTPLYMAPEQALGEAIDARSDLFSLGSVLYVMCTGRPPFRAATTVAVLRRVADEPARPIREIIPEVPLALCALIDHLHSKDPADRPASAEAVAARLRALRDELRGGTGRHHTQAGVPVALDPEFGTGAPPRRGKRPTRRPAGSDPGVGPAQTLSNFFQSTVWVALILIGAVILLLLVNVYRRSRPNEVATIVRTPNAPPPLPPVVVQPPQPPIRFGTWIDPKGQTQVDLANPRRPTITVPGGERLHLNPLPGFNLDAPRLLHEVSGDFTIEVIQLAGARPTAADVSPDRPEVDGYQWGGLVVWNDERNFLRFGVGSLPRFEQGRPFFDLKSHRNGGMADEDVRYAEPGPTRLRIDRRGDQLFVHAMIDGRKWTNVRTCSIAGYPASIRVGIAAINCGLHPYEVRFKDLSIGRPRDDGPFPIASTVVPSPTRIPDLGPWGYLFDRLGGTRAARDGDLLSLSLPSQAPRDLNPGSNSSVDAPLALRSVDGDFQYRVTVRPFARPRAEASARHDDNTYHWAGSVVWLNERNFVRFGVGRSTVDQGATFVTEEYYRDGKSRLYDSRRVVDDQPVSLLIERRGKSLRVASSLDGQTWTDGKPCQLDGLPTQLSVGVAAVNTGLDPFAATFDAGSLRSGATLAGDPEWATSPPTPLDLKLWGRLVDPVGDVRAGWSDERLTLSLPGGRLRDLNSTPEPGKNLDAPRTLRSATGDFTAVVRLPASPRAQPGPSGQTYRLRGILVWASAQDFLRFGVASNGEIDDGASRFDLEYFRNGRDLEGDVRAAPDGPISLRVERRGNRLYLSRSLDERIWLPHKVVDITRMPRTVQVGLTALNTTDEAFVAEFQGYSLRMVDPGGLVHLGYSIPSGSPDLSPWGRLVDPLGATSYEQGPNHLTLSLPADRPCDLNPQNIDNVNGPRTLRPVDGDFELRVTIPPFPKPDEAAAAPGRNPCYGWAGPVVWLDEFNFVRFGVGRNANGDGVSLNLELFRHMKPVLFHARWVDDRPVQLRLERRGNTLHVRSSSDGQTWVEGRTCDLSGWSDRLFVGVGAVNTSTRAFHPRFENWSLEPRSPQQP